MLERSVIHTVMAYCKIAEEVIKTLTLREARCDASGWRVVPFTTEKS